jgi:tRNA (guanosine-2'-O-)-methyltransferase
LAVDFEPPEVSMELKNFLTEKRLERIDAVLEKRTRNLTLLLEDIYDPHNVAACIRSAEGLGLQEVHVISKSGAFKPHPKVVQGGGKWVEISGYRSATEAAQALKARGFAIYAGALREDAVPIQSLDFGGKVAVAFGNEHDGLSPELLALADRVFFIPMRGFTQSFNISVATGMGLFHATEERRRLLGASGDLDPADKERLRSLWIEYSIPKVELLKKELASRQPED